MISMAVHQEFFLAKRTYRCNLSNNYYEKKKIEWKFFYSLGITFDLAVTAMMLTIATPRIITAIVPNSGTT